MIDRGSLLAFAARNRGDAGDDWLARVIERILERKLRDREDRRFALAEPGNPAASTIELAYSRRGDAIAIDAIHETTTLAAATAASVERAVARIAALLVARLGTTAPEGTPDPDELAAMQRIGAASFGAYRRFRATLLGYYSASMPDPRRHAAAARALVDEDPAWAHAYALLVLLEGKTTEAARAAHAAARAHADPARDPLGMKLLAGYDLVANGDQLAAFERFVEVYNADPDHVLAGTEVTLTAVAIHRTDEATAMTRRLHAHHPDLVFGMDFADALHRAGRDADREAVIHAWLGIAPDNLPAMVERIRIEAEAGEAAAAELHANQMLLVHGERDDVMPELFEALVAANLLSPAFQIADRMLVGTQLTRARGRYRVAVAAILQGRFASAYDSVRRAIDENRVFGLQSELVQCLELARSIAPLVGDAVAERRYTTELVEAFTSLIGDAATAAATRFELALLERAVAPPSIEDHLAGLPEGASRDVARRRMLRSAACADCGSPHKAVAAGFSAFEENTASLVALGLCAVRLREHDLARRSFARAAGLWSSMISNQNSPYHAVLARFHLAGVLAEQGDQVGARAAYRSFLTCWADSDRPIPEVAIARHMLEQK